MRLALKKAILNVKPYVPGKPINEVKRELGLKDVIKLASNESPYPPSPKVLKAIQEALKELNRYPDGNCYCLRQKLAEDLEVNPQQLLFGNGSDEIIVLAVRGFVNEGDEVVMAQPSFLVYEIASQIAGANIKAIPLKDFCYDLPKMKEAVNAKTKLIFLGNPDNPSGKYLTQSQMNKFLDRLSPSILVLIDEAYYEYVQAEDYVNSLNLLKKYKNVLITRTFSKMYGLAGLRIGYGIADQKIINYLNRLREPFNVNSVAQAAALACLEDKRYYTGLLKKINKGREFLYKNLKRLGLSYVESFTNFILIKMDKEDASSVVQALLKKGIIVRDVSLWGLKICIRITIGTDAENKKLIKALEAVMTYDEPRSAKELWRKEN